MIELNVSLPRTHTLSAAFRLFIYNLLTIMIADFGSYLRDTNRRFADQHITVDQDWLGGCVEWFLSENPQISNADLYKNAYEQWLLSDLVESGTKCLPQTVQNNKNEFELTGNYALQMQYLIDIGELLHIVSYSWARVLMSILFCVTHSRVSL